MPQTAQCLYFHLGIEADDDGFVTPRMIMKTLGSNDDDLKILIAKNFILPFESGVIVIRHWKDNNYIQSDRYKPTIYQDEYKIVCEDVVYNQDTQNRLVKDRLEKSRESSSKKLKPYYKDMLIVSSKGKKWCIPEDGSAWLEFDEKHGAKDVKLKYVNDK